MIPTLKLICLRNNEETILDSVSMLAGRSESCGIQVHQGDASREHARLTIKENKVIVQDLHSTNGTFVNNIRISEAAELLPGGIVKFAEESFSLQLIDNEATIVARPISTGNKRTEASIVDDEDDDEDSTVVFQTYQMPPGWSEIDSNPDDFHNVDDERKKKAIEAYVSKTRNRMNGRKGILFFFFVEQEPPSICSLSLESEDDQQWTFGRTETNDFSFRHQSISEAHALLCFKDKKWTIEDSKSTNGIWHNKKQVENLALSDGLVFYVGTVEVLARLINN